jgi:hypothetical protein
MKTLIVVALLLTPAIASAQSFGYSEPANDLRIDNYGKHGERTGYTIVNGKTGRVDSYDANSRRQGYGVINGGRVDTFTTRGERSGYLSITGPTSGGSTKR